MKLLPYTKTTYSCLFFIFCCLLLVTPLHGGQFEEEVSTQEYLFAKGMVRSVSPEDQTVTLKQKKGATISFYIDKDTVFEGFYKLTELKLRQKIKVWYQPKQEKNRASKILKPLELGC